MSAAARQAWISATERFAANPSSPHRLGSRAEVALSSARQEVARRVSCSEFDLIWTAGATESNNAIFFHAARRSEGEAWVSAIEHPSVVAAAQRWFAGRVRWLPVNADGRLDLEFLAAELKKSRPAIVSLMAANNETGVLQLWKEAFGLCREKEVPFMCDAAQWIGKEPAAGLGECDFVTGCGHKFGGALGVGILKAPPDFEALIVGGPQEEGRRAGTENLPGAVAFAAALEEREKAIAAGGIEERMRWRDQFVDGMKKNLPEVEILGENAPRLWNTVAALMPATADCRRRWVVQLDKLGFAVSTGSACASGKEKPSHVLTAMGCDAAKADRMLRFSSGWDTTEAEWMQLLDATRTAWDELAG